MNKLTTLERAGIRLVESLDKPGIQPLKKAIQLLRQAVARKTRRKLREGREK